jgi:hypothetical protein
VEVEAGYVTKIGVVVQGVVVGVMVEAVRVLSGQKVVVKVTIMVVPSTIEVDVPVEVTVVELAVLDVALVITAVVEAVYETAVEEAGVEETGVEETTVEEAAAVD